MKLKTGVIILGVFGGAFILYRAKQSATKLVTKTLNPASDKNFIYQGTQTAGKKIGRTVACWFNDCSGLPK